jgi:hypothetical protein
MKYVVVIEKLGKKFGDLKKHYYREFESYRQLRDYLVKQILSENEYVVYQETDIKIKKARGFAD